MTTFESGNQTADLSSQVRVWEGDQEEEVSVRPPGASAAAADVRLHAAHHRPAHQYHSQEMVSEDAHVAFVCGRSFQERKAVT